MRDGESASVLVFPVRPRPRVRVVLWEDPGRPDEDALGARLAADGYQAVRWSSEAAQGYPPHVHVYPELLWLVRGSLTVLLPAEDRMFELTPGDRIEIPQGTVHGTMAGPEGAAYLLATR